MKFPLFLGLTFCALAGAWAGPFVPSEIGQEELAAIPANDVRIKGWATSFAPELSETGPIDITEPGGAHATFGSLQSTLGPSDALKGGGGLPSTDPDKVLSLGDGGFATLIFDPAIRDGAGPDFAVFENGFNDTFLELAFVEVSSNGRDFFRFPSVSLTPLTAQIDQADPDHDGIDATDIDGLAGKYRAGLGTPFDLARLAQVSPLLVVDDVKYVRVRDVIGYIGGSVDAGTTTEDGAASYAYFGLSFAQNHIINDPWPTDFESGGFDLDAIGVLNAVPEPQTSLFLSTALGMLAIRRRKGA